jgi:hypothetical protein
VRNLVYSGLTMGKVAQVALFEGLPERYARRLVLENVTVAQATAGVSCSMAADVRIDNFNVGVAESAVVDAREVEGVEVHRVRSSRPRDGAPVVWLENVAGAHLEGCSVSDAGPGYEWFRQEQCRGVTLAANGAAPAQKPGGSKN